MSQLNTFPGSDYIRNPTPSLGRALTQAPGLARNIAGMAGSAANAAVTYSGPTSQPIAGSPMLDGTQNNAAPNAASVVASGPAPAAGSPGMNGGGLASRSVRKTWLLVMFEDSNPHGRM